MIPNKERPTMRMHKLLALLAALTLLAAAACGGDDDDKSADGSGGGGDLSGSITLMSAGEPEEIDAYQQIFDDLINDKVDYDVEVESVGDFEQQFQIRAEGGTLQVAAVPQPGSIATLADKGQIVALEDLGIDVDQLSQQVGESFVALGEHNGKHYGVPTNINLKSMVWYPKDDFDKAGYTVPKTWDELTALSDKIVADGGTPWCVGFGSEGSTGWPATDWMEDIVLRTAGPDTYDKWVSHEIPFNDPAIQHAGEVFGDVMFHKGYVLGGADKTADIAFGDAPKPMFNEPPGCWLHRQASFITSFFPEDAKAGEDYDWFPLPPIDRDGVLYGGELTVVGKSANKAVAADFLQRFIAKDVQCKMGGVRASSRISPNVDVGADCYSDGQLARASTVLTAALKDGSGRFDASDLMPKEVGQGSFWTGMVTYLRQGPSSLQGVLDGIERSWPR
jgi:alpha-glucoside transport system substrate-binding protein